MSALDDAVAEFDPAHVFALFSGGHDSLAAAHVTAQHDRFSGCVHINTGIGIEETREFVRESCRREGWRLLEYGPPVTGASGPRGGREFTYEDMVMKWGFPGPQQHRIMYTRLKERQLSLIKRDFPRSLLSTGIRHQESTRRMNNYVERGLFNEHRGFWWVNPIAEWTKLEVNAYLDEQRLPRNRVVDLLHMSGECLCGAFAKNGEMAELETWFPEVAAHLHDLESRTERAGLIGCVWGHRRDEVHADQQRLFPILPLCQSCEGRAALDEGRE